MSFLYVSFIDSPFDTAAPVTETIISEITMVTMAGIIRKDMPTIYNGVYTIG